MAGSLRKVNGVLEERGADGVWRRVEAQNVSKAGVSQGILDEIDSLEIGGAAPEDSHAENRGSDMATSSGPESHAETVAELDIGDVPGLLSDEGPKSTTGSARLQRLRQKARARGNGSSRVVARARKSRTIVVPQSAVEVTGPDAAGSRLKVSGAGRRQVGIKEAPSLLEDRPQWVRDLFEAHFRSELAYKLLHLPSGKSGKNRMKLSRADYAIGWLVCFDKAREDPGVLRIRDGKS